MEDSWDPNEVVVIYVLIRIENQDDQDNVHVSAEVDDNINVV